MFLGNDAVDFVPRSTNPVRSLVFRYPTGRLESPFKIAGLMIERNLTPFHGLARFLS